MNSHLLWLCIFLTLTLAFANERITGGQSVSQLDGRPFSYQVLLSVQTREGEFLCGGGLITNSHILTAAHCVTFFNPNTNKSELAESIEVNYGIRAASEANPETTAQVDYYSIGDYSPTNLRDDIAVLQVDRAILETEYTSIVPFYRGQIVEGSKYRVAGWGRTNDNTTDQSLEDLQYVELSVLSDAQCETRYLDYNRTGQFCLSGGAKDTCPVCFNHCEANFLG
jgi:secreted trypsin-like serine protease